MNKFVKDPVPIAVIGGSGAYHLLAEQSLGEEKKCQNIQTLIEMGLESTIWQIGTGDLLVRVPGVFLDQ